MMELLELFVFAIPVAVVAWVYSYVCTRPGQIFEDLYLFLEKHLPEKLFNPIIGCEKCVAGQLALWNFIFVVMPLLHLQHYRLVLGIYFICQSIFNVSVLKYLWLNIEVDTLLEGRKKNKIESHAKSEKKAEIPIELRSKDGAVSGDQD